MNKTNVTKEDFIDRICELFTLAQYYNKVADDLNYKLKESSKSTDINRFFRSQVYANFSTSIIFTNTLLYGDSGKGNKEIGLNEYNRKYTIENKKEFAKIKENFDKLKLRTLRNKFFAHQDLLKTNDGKLGSIAIRAIAPMDKNHIENHKQIIKQLNNFLQKEFGSEYSNVSLGIKYDRVLSLLDPS